MSKTTHRAAMAVLALSLGLATSLTANAAEAMRVVKDPVSGELRSPTAAEAAAFDKAAAALRSRGSKVAPQAQVEIRHPDGSVETKLGEDTHLYSVVSAAADGTLTFACLPAKEAQQFVKGKKALPAKTTAKVDHDHKH